MEDLINDYERKIKAVNELLEQQNDIVAIKRLETKRECYRAFIVDLKRAMADTSNENSGLHLQRVSNCASSCSFKEVKDIWNAAEKHVLHEMGEVCKGDANYEEDTPDLNTYYERHYY